MEKKFEKAEVEALLAVGLSNISFIKLNGDYACRMGTRDMTIVPIDMHPKNAGSQTGTSAVPFYDVEADCWKCFLIENLVAIEKQ